jgi:NADH-quinone oxidoreductase subunit K
MSLAIAPLLAPVLAAAAETPEAAAPAIGLPHYLLLGALLFVCGAVCMATKRNAIGVLMGVELVLNGSTVNFVAFARYNPAFEVEGQIFALFIIVMAAAEAAVALAIVLNFYNNHMTVDVDTAEELKG